MWYATWAALLANAWAASKNRRRALYGIAGLLLVQTLVNASSYSIRGMFGSPSFRQYVSRTLFEDVKKHIQLAPNERVGCVGFHPAVARYNELPTVGFNSDLSTPEQRAVVMRIVRPAVEKSLSLANHFGGNPTAIYLLDDQIPQNLGNQRKMKKRLRSISADFDTSALKVARVKYLLSTLPFSNAKEDGYQLVFERDDQNEYYRMFVYQVY